MTKHEAVLEQFRKATGRLREALATEKSDIVRDSAILRFEISMDLSWKTLKAVLESKFGVACHSPKGCFREAFKQGIIEYDEAWLDYVDMRNETAHAYKESLAEELFSRLPEVLKHFDDLINALDVKSR